MSTDRRRRGRPKTIDLPRLEHARAAGLWIPGDENNSATDRGGPVGSTHSHLERQARPTRTLEPCLDPCLAIVLRQIHTALELNADSHPVQAQHLVEAIGEQLLEVGQMGRAADEASPIEIVTADQHDSLEHPNKRIRRSCAGNGPARARSDVLSPPRCVLDRRRRYTGTGTAAAAIHGLPGFMA